MEEYIVKGMAGLCLGFNSYLDWKKREISLISLLVFTLAGIGMNLWRRYQTWEELLGGVLLGIFMILVAFFTREAIGVGDGLLLSVVGLLLGFAETWNLLVWGLVICALVTSCLFFLGVIEKEKRFPLVPFLMAAFVGGLLI